VEPHIPYRNGSGYHNGELSANMDTDSRRNGFLFHFSTDSWIYQIVLRGVSAMKQGLWISFDAPVDQVDASFIAFTALSMLLITGDHPIFMYMWRLPPQDSRIMSS
jgi:hypothetical protein